MSFWGFVTLALLLDQNLPWDRQIGLDLEEVSVGLSLLCRKSFSRARSDRHLAMCPTGRAVVAVISSASWLIVCWRLCSRTANVCDVTKRRCVL